MLDISVSGLYRSVLPARFPAVGPHIRLCSRDLSHSMAWVRARTGRGRGTRPLPRDRNECRVSRTTTAQGNPHIADEDTQRRCVMIRTAYNNRFRDHKSGQGRGAQRPGGRRDAPPRREHSGRRETATVVHPWMSLPDRLAAAQAAMRELAGHGAVKCPLGDTITPPPAPAAAPEPKSRPAGGVNVIIRKRRLPATAIPPLPNAG